MRENWSVLTVLLLTAVSGNPAFGLTEREAAQLGANEPIISYFDLNQDRSVDGRDWQMMTDSQRATCAVFSFAAAAGFWAATAGNSLNLSEPAINSMIRIGRKYKTKLTAFYRHKSNLRTPTIFLPGKDLSEGTIPQ